MKRLLCLVLSAVLLFSLTIRQEIQDVSATEMDISIFNFNTYKADINTDESLPPYKNMHYKLNEVTPSSIIVNELNGNPTFLASVALWETATFDPSEIVDNYLSEIEYYELIILSVLKTKTDASTIIDYYNKKSAKDTMALSKSTTKFMKNIYNVDFEEMLDRQNLTDKEKVQVSEAVDEWMKINHPKLSASSKALTKFSEFLDYYKSAKKALQNYTAYLNCVDMSEEMKTVVKDLYQRSTNPAMKTALLKVSNACESVEMATVVSSYDVSTRGFESVYKIIVEELWKDILSSTAIGKSVLIGQAVGKAVSNVCFSTDATIEQFYKMRAMKEFEDVLRSSVQYYETSYKNSRTTQNALNYFAAVDLLYSEYDLSCDFAMNYADILFSENLVSLVSFIFDGHRENYNSFIQSVERMKQNNKEAKESFDCFYEYTLEEDYPEIHGDLQSLYSMKNYIDIENISFDKESVEWGLKDFSYSYYQARINPDYATDKEIKYTSSNDSVVTYNAYGIPQLHGTGTAVITALSPSSGKTAQMRVTVVSEYGEDGIHLEDPNNSIVNDFEYIELSDGTIEIKRYIGNPNKAVIPSFINGKKVTSIGERAFNTIDSTRSLTKVVIPSSITSIGAGAFYECSYLTDIVLPSSVTSIGSSAFEGCYGLTNVTIPNSVTSIGAGAFYECGSLTNVTIPNSVTSIESSAFEGCCGLTNVTIPNSVTSIGNWAFSGCSSLTDIKIPYSVTSIERAAFAGCNSLTNIEIPSGITYIDEFVFDGCSSLKNIEIPSSVTFIASRAFRGCSSLKNIEIPDSVESIGDRAFDACSNLANVTIPDSVKVIGDEAFYACRSLVNITIPDSVTSIGEDAFHGCSSLTEIVLPSGVTSIGNRAFSGCSSLTEIVLPSGVTSIGNWAFSGCSSLTNIEIPSGITYIDEFVFDGCSSLKNIEIPSSVTFIASRAFRGCSSLKNIEIPDSVTSIEDHAFEECSSLKNIEIPDSVTFISYSAFEGCSNLILNVYSDSYALQYAKDHNIPYKIMKHITSVKLNKTTLTLSKGTTAVLKATVSPSDTTDSKTIRWKSSNTDIAIVNSSGTVKGLRPGTATITATSSNGKKATCKVTVPYTITYKLNGGTNNKNNPASYTAATSAITLKNPTREGYTFAGWYSDSSFKTKVTKIEKGSTGNRTLYAKWTKVSVTKAKTPTLANVSGNKLKISYSATSGAKGYQIQYSTNSKFTNAATKTVTATSYTTKALVKNKTYYVRVRAYKTDSAGEKVYGSWSTVKNKKITK